MLCNANRRRCTECPFGSLGPVLLTKQASISLTRVFWLLIGCCRPQWRKISWTVDGHVIGRWCPAPRSPSSHSTSTSTPNSACGRTSRHLKPGIPSPRVEMISKKAQDEHTVQGGAAVPRIPTYPSRVSTQSQQPIASSIMYLEPLIRHLGILSLPSMLWGQIQAAKILQYSEAEGQ